jgi:hypothetical protein
MPGYFGFTILIFYPYLGASKTTKTLLIKRSALFALIFWAVMFSARSQSLRYSVALPYTGLGAYSMQHHDVFSFTGNQAVLAQQKKAEVGIYGERRFSLAATSAYRVALAVPAKLGNFGLQVNYSGFKNFNENGVGLAYARSLGAKLDVGIQFNYYGYRIPAYGNAAAINFEAGAIMHFSDKLQGGLHVYNPVGGTLSKTDGEKLASAYKVGVGYDASENFFVSAEIVKEEDRPASVTAGVQYKFAQQLFARAGFVSGTSTGFGGVGLAWKNFRLDIAGSYHPQLGLSPGLMFIIGFNNKENQ